MTLDYTRQMPASSADEIDFPAEDMHENAARAATFLKAFGHEGRLMILCHLVESEKSVSELETLLSARQAAVSQQLARLRQEGLVTTRRDGKTVHYRLADDKPRHLIELLHGMFCKPETTS